jgi:hypothetical protein
VSLLQRTTIEGRALRSLSPVFGGHRRDDVGAGNDGMNGNRLIQRYEHHYFRGFVVATKRQGKRWVQYFSDGPDGRAAALRRAREYRDALLASLPRPTKLKRTCRTNLTGVIGVARLKERTRAGRPFARYVASWPREGGARGTTSFSVALYGEAEARRLAVRARRAGVEAFMRAGQRTTVKQSGSHRTRG